MTKERLKECRSIKLEKDRLALWIEEIESGSLYSPKAQRLDGMPRGGSAPGSAVEEAALRHDDLLSRYRRKEAELIDEIAKIETAIETLDPRERTLIRLHYVEGLTWEEVCATMTYSWRQVHRIHSSALEKLKSEKEKTP